MKRTGLFLCLLLGCEPIDLVKLSPFPCATDGTCPEPFTCLPNSGCTLVVGGYPQSCSDPYGTYDDPYYSEGFTQVRLDGLDQVCLRACPCEAPYTCETIEWNSAGTFEERVCVWSGDGILANPQYMGGTGPSGNTLTVRAVGTSTTKLTHIEVTCDLDISPTCATSAITLSGAAGCAGATCAFAGDGLDLPAEIHVACQTSADFVAILTVHGTTSTDVGRIILNCSPAAL